MPDNAENKLPIIAIDLGGTKIATAIISADFRVVARDYSLTLAEEGPQQVVGRLFSTVDRLLSQNSRALSEVEVISIAAAGAIDSERGVVTSSPNLPGWSDIRLRDAVKEHYGIDTFLVNDASAAALGEHRLGAGRGSNNLIYITVSTGIGGGIIVNGELYLGQSGCAGEIGHMTIDVNGRRHICGNIGCLEVLASGTAMAEDAIKRIRKGEDSALVEMVDNIDDITAEEVARAARAGDWLALDVISRAVNFLGVGVVSLVNIFNPEIIVIGGGVAKMGNLLFNPIRQAVKEKAFKLCADAVSIVPAKLGDDAGLLGAAIFARQQKSGGRAG